MINLNNNIISMEFANVAEKTTQQQLQVYNQQSLLFGDLNKSLGQC